MTDCQRELIACASVLVDRTHIATTWPNPKVGSQAYSSSTCASAFPWTRATTLCAALRARFRRTRSRAVDSRCEQLGPVVWVPCSKPADCLAAIRLNRFSVGSLTGHRRAAGADFV